MSLQYWFPLNQDLRNIGVASLASADVQSGCNIADDGKLGRCYKNTGANNSVATPISFSADKFSLCAWMRIDTKKSNWTRALALWGNNTYIGLGCEASNGTNLGFHYYKTIDGTNTNIFDTYPCIVQVGTWVHYTMIYDGTKYYIYENGTLKQSANANKANIKAEMNTLYLFGHNSSYSYTSLNDVRIYDHALSAKEVQEIAQGLVIHLPLNDNGTTSINMFETTPRAATTTAYNAYQINMKTNLVAGSTYTIQLWDVNVSHTGKTADTLGVWLYWGGGSVQLLNWHGTTYFTNGHADYLTATFTITDSQASGTGATNSWINVYNSTSYAAGTMSLTIGRWRLEKATRVYEDTIEYDVSGYHNDGIPSGVTYPETSIRYSASTTFDTNTDTVTLTPCWVLNQIIDKMSVSIWFKTNTMNSTAPNLWSLGQNSFARIRLASATSILYYLYGVSNTYTTKTLTDDVWHHCVFTFNQGIVTMYIDGAQVGQTDRTADRPTLKMGSTSWFLAGYTDTSEKFKGSLSDFRVYATCLDANMVKDLYQVSASVDKGNSLHAFEYSEPNDDELLAVPFTSAYDIHDPANQYSTRDSEGHYYFEGTTVSAGSEYIKVQPSGKTYYYDIEVSIAAGNYFYIGFERYDADKTPRSNNACVYVIATKPASDIVRQRYEGTVDLSTDGVNPCDTIALRVLNGWGGSDSSSSKTATVYYLSLRQVSSFATTSISKQGVETTDMMIEGGVGDIEKTGVTNMLEFIET